MESIDALSLLECNLGYYGTDIDAKVEEYLRYLLKFSTGELAKAHIIIDLDLDNDVMLLVLYAAWLYRGGPSGMAKPQMLQTLIRNRQVDDAITEGSA